MINIRFATTNDVSAITEIEAEVFADPWHFDSVAGTVGKEHFSVVVADEDGYICGYIICYHILNEGDIARIAVRESHRRRGIAGRMLEFLFATGRAYGLTEFSLDVREHNTGAIALYTKYGFKEEGRRKNYYEHPTENAIVMWRRRTQNN